MRIDGSKILNPGLLRHQITWQTRTLANPDSGDDAYAYSDILTCRARVEQPVGKELESMAQIFAEARYKITQHYSRGLTRDMRVYWLNDGVALTLDVVDIVDPVGTGRYQIVYAKDHVE